MQINSYSTTTLSSKDLVKTWVVLDAKDQPLGRLASVAASHLIGKYRSDYTPHMDCGSHVIIINVAQIRLSGRKWDRRVYFHLTGYPGSPRRVSARRVFDKDPRRLVARAVKGMLRSNRVGRAQVRHLHVYVDDKHVHQAQQPTVVSLSKQ